MENMKSLADQVREQLSPKEKSADKTKKKIVGGNASVKKEKSAKPEVPILQALKAFDNSQNKTMVHVRFDSKTAGTMNKFKMATNIDVTKLVAFAVHQLFETHPELKTVIIQFIQNTEL